MSQHGKLREIKACENCGRFVEKRFCPECGQENVETRQRFYHLFTHFIEDFVHYDSRFWKTILYLLIRPAKLTKEYMAGKRKLFVPPVTLYIFISFITFFIPAILPDSNKSNQTTNPTEQVPEPNVVFRGEKVDIGELNKDAMQERIIHDFPKAIFLYMPIFAFWLWLFHSKKKWYYFDHGIYTLHYFSFLLLGSLLLILINWIISFFSIKMGSINNILIFTVFIYFIYYFFHSHRLVYQETKAISRLKCSFLFIINTFCILFFLIFYMITEAFISNPALFEEIKNSINKG